MSLKNFRSVDFEQKDSKVKIARSKRDRVERLSDPVPTTTPVVGDNPDEVPTGTVPEIVTWVGDDLERAQKALDKEVSDDKPRKGLVSQLQDMIDAAASDDEPHDDSEEAAPNSDDNVEE